MASKYHLTVSCFTISLRINISNNLLRQTSLRLCLQRTLVSSEKPMLVVLGAGWGGFRVARDLDKTKFDVTVVSPRNHFLFTPLLPSTTVGTLEFRCVQEPVRTIKGVHYPQASARNINFNNKEVLCVDLYEHFEDGAKQPRNEFKLSYDKLVLGMGTKSNTFGVPGLV